jgi:hypothetical protein
MHQYWSRPSPKACGAAGKTIYGLCWLLFLWLTQYWPTNHNTDSQSWPRILKKETNHDLGKPEKLIKRLKMRQSFVNQSNYWHVNLDQKMTILTTQTESVLTQHWTLMNSITSCPTKKFSLHKQTAKKCYPVGGWARLFCVTINPDSQGFESSTQWVTAQRALTNTLGMGVGANQAMILFTSQWAVAWITFLMVWENMVVCRQAHAILYLLPVFQIFSMGKGIAPMNSTHQIMSRSIAASADTEI